MSSYRISVDAIKDPAESLNVLIDCFEMCGRFWKSNEFYSLNEVIRPRVANGTSLIVTSMGTSGAEEPQWAVELAATTPDGSSLVWTTQLAGTDGVNSITSPSCVSDPLGLTIINVTVNELYKINATYQGGVAGKHYDAVYSFTLDGVTRVARQRVNVRKR